MLKYKIRKKILKIRKNRSKSYIKFRFFYDFLKKKINLSKKIIGGYYPVNHEMDDINILKELENKNFKIALPLIKKNFKMDFVQCSLKDPLTINQYGIPEPSKGKIVYPDVLLVPLVAFDKKLNRLGYGAGYYDRIIEFLRKRKKIIAIGLAYEFQQHYSIPTSKHDQRLNYIITNKSIFK